LIVPPSPDASPASHLRLPARLWRRPWSAEALTLLVCLFFVLVSNRAFWQQALADRSWSQPGTWQFAASAFVALVALQFALLVLPMTQRLVRPLLALLLFATAFASYFMQKYSAYLDPVTLRAVVRTDIHEAGELFSWSLLPHLLWQAVLPAWLLWRLPLNSRRWQIALGWRLGWMFVALLVAAAALFATFADISSLMRNQPALRYLITPGNYVYSLVRATGTDARQAAQPLVPIGTDAALGPGWRARTRPVLMILVVGETARAANWGLSGYARQTTPELARLDVINYTDVTSCGTATETSLPCMFAPVGRRQYDEQRIRSQESLLHVLNRAGFAISWRDNQSGCKGVCKDLPAEQYDTRRTPGLCDRNRCLDEILFEGLDAEVADASRSRVIVMHGLGSHGPSYFDRYPEAFRRFTPTCDTGDLRRCSSEEIVNAYDNSLLYTDHVLARTIAFLQAQQARYDTLMVYVSDHGESLGEKNLYLHGVPYPIAPREQTHVPMVMWLSPGYRSSFGVDLACLREHATQPVSHDHLFHSTLGLLDVQTTVREPAYDISAACRPRREM
jgi:lipid A ethanolaminephosphotransferase